MLKTCYNCKSYYTICDSDDLGCHWHDFCSRWEKILNGWNYYSCGVLSEVVDDIIYDDFETGVAECYMFSPRTEPFRPDEWFQSNKEHNDKLVDLYNKLNECPDTCPGKNNKDWRYNSDNKCSEKIK